MQQESKKLNYIKDAKLFCIIIMLKSREQIGRKYNCAVNNKVEFFVLIEFIGFF